MTAILSSHNSVKIIEICLIMDNVPQGALVKVRETWTEYSELYSILQFSWWKRRVEDVENKGRTLIQTPGNIHPAQGLQNSSLPNADNYNGLCKPCLIVFNVLSSCDHHSWEEMDKMFSLSFHAESTMANLNFSPLAQNPVGREIVETNREIACLKHRYRILTFFLRCCQMFKANLCNVY